jgi:hypothetical protein
MKRGSIIVIITLVLIIALGAITFLFIWARNPYYGESDLLKCKEITSANYTTELDKITNNIGIIRADHESGMVPFGGYASHYKEQLGSMWYKRGKFEEPKEVALKFGSTNIKPVIYPSGIFIINCDNKDIKIFIPELEIFTYGAIQDHNTTINNQSTDRLYVSEDGSTYYDYYLTDVARIAE